MGGFFPPLKAWHLPGEHQQRIRLCWGGQGKTQQWGLLATFCSM